MDNSAHIHCRCGLTIPIDPNNITDVECENCGLTIGAREIAMQIEEEKVYYQAKLTALLLSFQEVRDNEEAVQFMPRAILVANDLLYQAAPGISAELDDMTERAMMALIEHFREWVRLGGVFPVMVNIKAIGRH